MPYRIEEFNHRPHIIPDATESADGLMSAADKTKLDGISAVAIPVVWVEGQPWSSVYPRIQAAIAANEGVIVQLTGLVGPWTIDNTFPVVNFDGVVWLGLPSSSRITVNAGVTLGGGGVMESYFVFWTFNGTFLTTAIAVEWYIENGGIVNNGPTPLIVSSGVGGLTSVQLTLVRSFAHPAGGAIVQLTNGGVGTMDSYRNNTLNDAGIFLVPNAGANAVVVIGYDADGEVPTAAIVTGTQVTLTLLKFARAINMTYTPAVSANWNNSNPTSVAAALDRIAAKIGPIP